MTSTPRFIHLRVHTEHSLLEGAVPVKALVKLCVKARMPAVAVTDTNNMFAALEFSVTAREEGLQPIVGCQISLAYGPTAPGEKLRPPAPIVLLAQNEAGYMNLMKLNSALYIGKGGQLPQVTMAELQTHNAGLICLTGGPDGPLGRLLQTGQTTKARALLERLAATFPTASMSSCNATPAPAATCLPPRRCLSKAMSRWPMRWACRWWPPTMSISRKPRCTRHMMP